MTSRSDSRADQILARFVEFHRLNPQVWELFERFAWEIIARGRTRYSVSAIVERIRWHIDIETSGEVKINNDFRAYYARMFMAKYPEYPLFEVRRRLSATKPAYKSDVPVIPPLPAVDEFALNETLRGLAR